MNAGVRGLDDSAEFLEIKDIIKDVEVMDLKDRKIKSLAPKDIGFKYRSSGLDGKIILGARIGLKVNKKENIQERINAFNKRRAWLSNIGFPNAGSVFKNPAPDKPAGMLIDACGLKGKRIGGAEISAAHANVIVNIGKAKAKDVLDLVDLARAGVRQKFGIDLELELKIV
jgi:UDP-N-acetylmuramate dehydrogenase